MLLQKKNYHPRDERITFHEKTHTYEVDGSSDGIMSVTTFIHSYFPHFDADRVIKKMKNKKEKYPNMTDDQIKKEWNENGKRASEQGTHMHRQIELFYNNEKNDIIENPSIELNYFSKFNEDIVKNRCLEPFRTEWSIFDGDIDLAGQLDMLYKKEDGTFALYDWKRVKEIKDNNPYGEKGFGCLSLLDHCNYNHYSLQLNIYKKILQTRYDMHVSEMFLVALHPDNESYRLIEVGDMSDYVNKIFKERYDSIRNE